MTPQEIFDTVAKHLFVQGKQALRIDDRGIAHCMYRAPDGCKCAVGCLIPDPEYSPTIESHGLNWLKLTDEHNTLSAATRDLIHKHFILLGDLQRVHDYSYHWASEATLRSRLTLTATSFKLDHSILNSLHFSKAASEKTGNIQ